MKHVKRPNLDLFETEWENDLFFKMNKLYRNIFIGICSITFIGSIYNQSFSGSLVIVFIIIIGYLIYQSFTKSDVKKKKVNRLIIKKETTKLRYFTAANSETEIIIKNELTNMKLIYSEDENSSKTYSNLLITNSEFPNESFNCLSNQGLWDNNSDLPKLFEFLKNHYSFTAR